jgi:hypothetical protein
MLGLAAQRGDVMVNKNKVLHVVGAVLFLLAILLGVLLTIARAWPDMEAALYGFIKDSYPRLRSLHCPVLMTSQDRLPVTVQLTNPLNQDLTWFVRAQFSTSLAINTVEQKLVLKPGESRMLSWDVDTTNIDLRHLILAYAFASPSAGLRMTEGTCGTYVLNVPIKGGPTIYYSGLGLSVLCVIAGFFFWLRYADLSDPAVIAQSWWMRFLALVIAIGVVTSIVGWWFIGIIALVLTMLTLIVYLVR